jgi:predicted acylesterase/phospholipase RssA
MMFVCPLLEPTQKIRACEMRSAEHYTELDPTSAAPLKQLKEQVLAVASVQHFLKDLNGGQLSLVLSGGGGKGAYEAGVVLALFDCGINHFSALSGTSVGALNAAMCHEVCRLKDRGLVTRIWGQMSYSRVLRPSWLIPIALARFIQRVVFALRTPSRLKSRLTDKLGRSSELANDDGPPGVRAVIGEIVNDVLRQALRAALILVGTILLLFVLGYIYFKSEVQISGRDIFFGIVFFMNLPLIFLLIRRALRKSPSLFSNAPLRTTIIDSIDVRALRESETPIFCTFALFDPITSVWHDEATLLHDYKSLNKSKSDEEVMQALLQSAALPEIFPARKVDEAWCIDGGLVDNTPILPVYYGTPLGNRNTLIVVYLDAKLGSRANLEADERLRVKKLARRWEFFAKLDHTMPDHTFSDLLDQQITQWRFFPIIPSTSLGNLITGTMNFTVCKARRLIEMGYRDTLLTIQRASDSVVSQ